MRNIWALIVRYQLILTFIILQGLTLGWFVSSHGYPRGKWVRASLDMQGTWSGYVSQMTQLTELADQNRQLLLENAQLKSQVVRFLGKQNPLTLDHPINGSIIPAEVIRSTVFLSSNFLILNKGTRDGVMEGQGILHGPYAVGRVIETTETHALVIPLIHTKMEWSARLGSQGPVGRLIWNGEDPQLATLSDVPKSFTVRAGDTIFTSGFQGIFPSEIPYGLVTANPSIIDGEFQNLEVQLGAPFQQLRYVHVVETGNRETVNDLMDESESLFQ